MIEALKQPPHSLEAEQSVIGALLIQPDAFDRIDWLQESHFFGAANRAIYKQIRSMIETGKPVDALLVGMALGEGLESVGGRTYLGDLAAGATTANLHRYAAIVRDKALLRGLMTHAMELADAANQPGADALQIAEQADSRLFDIQQGQTQSDAQPFHVILDKALLHRKSPGGLPTGLPDVDRLMTLKKGHLIVLAGRPSMGKSALATGIAEHVASSGEPVWFGSLEMSHEEIGERILGWHEKRVGLDRAASKLSSLPLYIDVLSNLTIGLMRLKLRRQKRKYGVSLAVVDYLQLMSGKGENRTQEVGSISRGLKQLAIEFQIPVIAVSQLNRGLESRTDKRPLMSDLRESGDIEQDADIAAFVYRDEYYNASSVAAGTAEILVRKHRNGRIGMARLTFIAEHARFESYAGPPIYDDEPPKAARTGRASVVDFKSRAGGD